MSNTALHNLPEDELDALQKILPAVAPEHLRTKTAQEILTLWRQTVAKMLNDYEGSADDYRGELDVRRAIEDAFWLPAESPLTVTRKWIDNLDQTFRTNTHLRKTPLLDTDDPERHWFFFRIPKRQGPLMSSQLYGNGEQAEIVDTD